jgi:hypothetical protein
MNGNRQSAIGNRARSLFAMMLILAGVATLAGCSSPEDFVDMQTTAEMRKQFNAPPKVSLTEFNALKEELRLKAEADAEALVAKAKAEADKTSAEVAKVQAQAESEQRQNLRAIAQTTRSLTAAIRELQAQAEADLARLAEKGEELDAAARAELTRAIRLGEDRVRALQGELERHQANAARSKERNESLAAVGQAKADQLRSLINFGLNEIAPAAAAAFPGAGAAIPIIAGLVGLYTRKPGTSKEIAEAAEKARAEERARADRLQAELGATLARLKHETDIAYDQGRNETLTGLSIVRPPVVAAPAAA